MREVGARGHAASELFAPKGDATGLLRLLMIVIFFAAGLLEVVSILFRPVSLSFRLYGNIFAGETMLETMATLVPDLGWLVPVPFYFLELLVGMVQAHGVHAADGRLHAAHLPASRGRIRRGTTDARGSIASDARRPSRKEQRMTGNFHIALAVLGATLAVGLIGMTASAAVGRNPGAATPILVQSILAIAFAEAIVFYALFLVQ